MLPRLRRRCFSLRALSRRTSTSKHRPLFRNSVIKNTPPVAPWLHLAVVADCLQIVKQVSVETQRNTLRVLDADVVLHQCRDRLSDYVAESTGTLARAFITLRKATKDEQFATCVENVCNLIRVTKMLPNQWTAACKIGKTVIQVEIKKHMLTDVIGAAKKLVETLNEELDRRFKNTDIMNASYVLRADYYEPVSCAQRGAGVAPNALEPAMRSWSEHFGVSSHDLTKEFRLLLAYKNEYNDKYPERAMLAPHDYWPPLLKLKQHEFPLAVRCVAAHITLSWQNASVDRDLAILERVKDHTKYQNMKKAKRDGLCKQNGHHDVYERVGNEENEQHLPEGSHACIVHNRSQGPNSKKARTDSTT